jgi:hypothetical protein
METMLQFVAMSWLFFGFLLGQTLMAQQNTSPKRELDTHSSKLDSPSKDQVSNAAAEPGRDTSITPSFRRFLTSYEFILALMVLVFGIIVLGVGYFLLKPSNPTPEGALRFYGVIVIVIGTLFLIVAGLNNDQIAPAVGLFGTLAGYLLGRKDSAQ